MPQNQQQPPTKHHIQDSAAPASTTVSSTSSNSSSIHASESTYVSLLHSHQCSPSSHLPEISHTHQLPTVSQHMACLQSLAGGHIGSHLHVLPTSSAKFCDECGAPYLGETPKFCTECGVQEIRNMIE